MTFLSGYFLQADGWKKNGFEWTKGYSTIRYNGTSWTVCTVADVEEVNEGGIRINWRTIDYVEEIKKK